MDENDMKISQKIDDIPWRPHPHRPSVSMKPLITSEEHNLNATCMLVNVPVGKEIPEHIHEEQDEILLPLQGRAVMWVEGAGDFSVGPDVIFRVPKGMKHKIADIAEDLLLYCVFVPALF